MGDFTMSEIIFKIVNYFPEQNSISIKFCKQKSSLPIDSFKSYAIDLNGVDLSDFDSFSNELVQKFGLRISQNQEDGQETIKENIPEEIHNFDIKNMIGKVIEGKYYSRNRYPLKMRRIEL
tara:strand:- start:5761 stop:6123 length:363 start_codon:yes stop_codon:yes gene_type:complete